MQKHGFPGVSPGADAARWPPGRLSGFLCVLSVLCGDILLFLLSESQFFLVPITLDRLQRFTGTPT
jgi:hypothetical protein